MPFIVLLIAVGDQTPDIPLGEVVFNNGAIEPEHKVIEVTKSGTILLMTTVTFVIKIAEHCPTAVVNVYEPLTVLLITAGDQVPVTPFGDALFNIGALFPAQRVIAGKKSGVIVLFTITCIWKFDAHCPAVGLKV